LRPAKDKDKHIPKNSIKMTKTIPALFQQKPFTALSQRCGLHFLKRNRNQEDVHEYPPIQEHIDCGYSLSSTKSGILLYSMTSCIVK